MKRKTKLSLEITSLFILAGLAIFLVDPRAKPRAVKKRAEYESFAVPEERASVKLDTRPAPYTLTLHNAEKAYPGFNLYSTTGSAEILLVNMSGQTVHRWDFDSDRVRFLPNCNILVVHGSKWGIDHPHWSKLRNHVREYDWDGNLVWEYVLSNPAHHDIQRLENGNTLILERTVVPAAKMREVENKKRAKAVFRSDRILEVTPEGQIVWDWNAHDHLDLNSCGAKECPKMNAKLLSGEKEFDWTHTNTISPIPDNKWFRQGDARFTPGNIFVLPRNFWQAMIIDRATKDIVWLYRGDYRGGIVGGHEAHMIHEGLPGAGNVLIFDNGRDREQSAILELNPVTMEPVWVYDQGKKFFSRIAGSAQRLPNGNTLISEDATGRVFEVTPEKEMVWEMTGTMRVNRLQRYDREYCPMLQTVPVR